MRVMWLRAHARKCRWEEEVVLLQEEMYRTTATFLYEAERWRTREEAATGGQKAWAARQAALWTSLRTHAKDEFATAQANHKAPSLPF